MPSRCLLFLLFLFAHSQCDAQLYLSPFIGGSFANGNVSIKGRSGQETTHSVINVAAGLGIEYRIIPRLHIQSGLQFSGGGFKSYVHYDNTFRTSSIELPLYVLYRSRLMNKSGFYIGTGLYAAHIFKTDNRMLGYKYHVHEFISPRILPVNFGMGLQIGFNASRHVLLGACYQRGLTDVVEKGNEEGVSYLPYQVKACATYFFKPGKKKKTKDKVN